MMESNAGIILVHIVRAYPPILGPGKQVAAHVRESKIPAQGLRSTCAGALAVQKG